MSVTEREAGLLDCALARSQGMGNWLTHVRLIAEELDGRSEAHEVDELCTLKHAFVADNLLGLVFKIVQERHEPVSQTGRYSQDLSDLIDRLLEKDPQRRPSVREILKMDLIRRKAKEFLESNEVQRSKTIVCFIVLCFCVRRN